jgi:hypothetical protein
MAPLRKFTDGELKSELDRREKEREEREMPRPLAAPDFSSLIALCDEYIKAHVEEEYVDDDYDHGIYEQALECIYGKDVFDWINAKS